MKRFGTLGAALCLAAGVAGCSGDETAPPAANPFPPLPTANTTYFDVTDEAGRWFDTRTTIAGTNSLAVVPPGQKIRFLQTRSFNGPSRVESFHTVTSLIFPSNATTSERIDQPTANKDDHEVTLNTPGLYVFVCKVHPYMLGGVIVDDPNTKTTQDEAALDIGNAQGGANDLHLEGVGDFTSNSNLGLRLLRAFFIVTSPSNWKDYTKVTTPPTKYQPAYPPVAVRVNPVGALGPAQGVVNGIVPNLNAALQGFFDGEDIVASTTPTTPGVGEVWVDTQYEESAGKGPAYPSTITVVDAATWAIKQKIALPNQKMNNGHNMWASHDQNEIYQTEWHGESLYVLNRTDGSLKQELVLGPDPAHVMTRVNNGQVHVGLNGGDAVSEMDRNTDGTLTFKRNILVQLPGQPQAQPHAHWMGFDGLSMVTPNSNSGDSTLYDFSIDGILAKNTTGPLPIAAAMDPRSIRYYVSNYLGHSISVMCGPNGQPLTCNGRNPGQKIADVNLLQNYNPVTGIVGGNGAIGGLPIQTPVSPDGRFVVTGNTLTATISIINTQTATLVKSLPCDPGCHGVNFGAKSGGGYYAYVTSKFANRLLVYDIDPNGDGNAADAALVGSIVLVDGGTTAKDDTITGNRGMGGQGVLPVPNVYNGWVQALPANSSFCSALNASQKDPFPAEAPATLCP
jgi:hypothetical protein